VDQEEKQALARLLQGVDSGSVLGIGAGTGHMTTYLVKQGYHMTAIEPCQATREEGKRQTEAYLVREIIAAHEGHIEVQSALGQGSTFSLSLPCAGARPQTGFTSCATSDGRSGKDHAQ
jgi:hypothetical protein